MVLYVRLEVDRLRVLVALDTDGVCIFWWVHLLSVDNVLCYICNISFTGHLILFMLLWMMQILTLKTCRMCPSCSSPDFEAFILAYVYHWIHLVCLDFP